MMTVSLLLDTCSKNMEIPILKGSARISSRLNFVCPQLFPSSGFWPVEPSNGIEFEKNKVNSHDIRNTQTPEVEC
jgi:ribonuclease Z